jgi:hypothetical protein
VKSLQLQVSHMLFLYVLVILGAVIAMTGLYIFQGHDSDGRRHGLLVICGGIVVAWMALIACAR